MDYEKIMTIMVVFVLIFSGISVVTQSLDAEDNESQESKGIVFEEDSSEQDSLNKIYNSISKDYLGLDIGQGNAEVLDNIPANPVKSRGIHDDLSIQIQKSLQKNDDFVVDDKLEERRITPRPVIDEQPARSYKSQKPISIRDPDNLESMSISKKHDQRDSQVITKRAEDDEFEEAFRSNDDMRLIKTTSTGSGELILDLYKVTFQDNMTALSVNATFSIYKVKVAGTVFTAEDIRNAGNTSEMMEWISNRMGDVFNETIFSAFPDEKKVVHETTHDVGTYPDPINVSCSADVYLRKTSFGFDKENKDLNLSDVILGTMKMGASINKGVNLKVKPGHNSTYQFEVPSPMVMGSEDTIGFWGGTNRTWDDQDIRTSTWVYNNTEGNKEVILSKNINVSHEDPLQIEHENINGVGILDMTSFEEVSITDIFNVSSVYIGDYTKPGKDEPMLPSNVSGLEFISADGLRLMLDNGLTDLQVIRDQSINKSIENAESSIQDLFGEEPDLQFEWDQSTVTGYDVETMGTTPPVRGYLNSTEPVGFTNQKLDMPTEADIDELVTEALKLDTYITKGFDMIVEEGLYFILKIKSPENVKFEDSTPLENDRYLYQKDIDNREGGNYSTHLDLNMSWSGEVRTYEEEDIGSETFVNIISFDDILIDINMKVTSVKVDRYGDEFDTPDTIHDLKYIDGNFIRVAVRNDLVELSTIYNESIKPARKDISTGLKTLFGEDVVMEFEWESLEWKEWTSSEWESNSPELGAFKGYLNTVEPAAFTPTSLGLPEGSDVGELVREVLKLDTTLTTEFALTVSEDRWLELSIKTPEHIGIEGGEKESGRWNKTWYKEMGDHVFNLNLYWTGPGLRIYHEEDIGSTSIVDMKSFDNIMAELNISIGAVNISKYEDRFTVPETVDGLDYVDGDFIRVAVRNDLVELSTIYNESIKGVKTDMEDGIEEMIGENVTLSFSWEDRTWETVESYRKTYPSGLGNLRAYLTLEESVSFSPDSLDLPKEADVGEIVRAVLKLDTTIQKEVSFNVTENVGTSITVIAPEDIMFEKGEKFGKRWSRTYSLGEGSNTVSLVLRYDGEVREIEEEKVFVNATLDMYDLDSLNANVSISILSVNIDNYEGGFSIPDAVKGLDYLDHRFIRTAVDNHLVKWETITDEMNNSVDEFESEIPNIIGDIDFTYSDPGKDTGPIVRRYGVKDYKLDLTTEETEDIEIDHDLIKAIMNSGAVADFEFESVEGINENYATNLKLGTPEFMKLYDSSGELKRHDGYYEIDPTEGFNGSLRSGVEGPDKQSINFYMKIDLAKISIETDILDMGYKIDADTMIDAQVMVQSVELPQSMRDKIPEEINLEYATANLIREAERSGLFEKQEILKMLRDGKDIDGFEGMNKTLQDALDNDDIGVDIGYKEGTWEIADYPDEIKPLILVMDSEFVFPVKESGGGNALEIYSTELGEMDIPSIEGIDTSFKIVFPSGIEAGVEETDNVKTGNMKDGRNYIEVITSGDSDGSVTINPTIIITEKLLFSTDVHLHGIPILVITVIIISLILLGIIGIALKLYPIEKMRKKKLIRKGMKDASEEEDDPDRWLNYIPAEKREKYDITRSTLADVGLEEELDELREKTEKEEEPFFSPEDDEPVDFEDTSEFEEEETSSFEEDEFLEFEGEEIEEELEDEEDLSEEEDEEEI